MSREECVAVLRHPPPPPPPLRVSMLVSSPPCMCRSQQDIMLKDACPATSDPVACASAHSGLLTKGLFAAVESFAHLYTELVQTRGLANGNFSVVQVSARSCRWHLRFVPIC